MKPRIKLVKTFYRCEILAANTAWPEIDAMQMVRNYALALVGSECHSKKRC